MGKIQEEIAKLEEKQREFEGFKEKLKEKYHEEIAQLFEYREKMHDHFKAAANKKALDKFYELMDPLEKYIKKQRMKRE